MSSEDVRDLGEHLDGTVRRLEREGGRVTITQGGVRSAVLISVSELESIEETIAVLAEPGTMLALAQSERAIAGGDVLDAEELIAYLARHRGKS